MAYITKILLAIILLIFATNIFAVSCPGASDFERKKRTIASTKYFGNKYAWDLRTTNINETKWYVNSWIIWSSATTDTFPLDIQLLVSIWDDEKSIDCDYSLPAGTLELSSRHKKINVHNLANSLWPRKGLLFECKTTARNPQACSWEWLS